MSDGYTTLDQKPFLSHYLYTSTVIDHPVEEVSTVKTKAVGE